LHRLPSGFTLLLAGPALDYFSSYDVAAGSPADPLRARAELNLPMNTPPVAKLPDPWLFDSEALLRELDRCRETVLQIPITNANATHFGIQLAVNAIYNLTENLRYLLHLHREQQRFIRKQHDQCLGEALSTRDTEPPSIVPLHRTSAPSNGKTPDNIARTHSQRERLAKRRRASSVDSSQVA
jgi:hypothetical protein